MEILAINKNQFEEKILKSNEKVLVDFYADWCGPCKSLGPIIEEVAMEQKDITFYKVNVDKEHDVAKKYGIMSIPTLILFENGKVINKSVGLVSKKELINFVNNE